MVMEMKESLTSLREDFKKIFEEATLLAEDIGITITKPRTVGIQRYRRNAGTESSDCTEAYFRQNYFNPAIDSVVQNIEDR